MTAKGRAWVVVLVFLALAGVTRFYRIGQWSFTGEPVNEARSLQERPFFLDNPEGHERGPRVIPVSYVLQGLVFRIFGTSHAGIRARDPSASSHSLQSSGSSAKARARSTTSIW